MSVDEEFIAAVEHHRAGRMGEAAHGYQRVLAMHPKHADALNNLAGALLKMGQAEESVAVCRRALEVNGEMPEVWSNLGNALNAMNRPAEALDACRKAIALSPHFAEALNNLGSSLLSLGRLPEALEAFKRAEALRPEMVEAISNAGGALAKMGRLEEAAAAFSRALQLRPNHAAAASNFGAAMAELGRPDEAIAWCRRALALCPSDAYAHNNLGNACKDAGQLDAAIQCYRRAMQLDPSVADVHSNVVYAMQFHPDCDEASLHAEQRRWNQVHAEPLRRGGGEHGNDRAPNRRLKIGYVSPYFYSHAESFFTLPLLEHHDHERIEIHCYSSVQRPDELTRRTRSCADVWHEASGLSDAELADQIRRDGIDVLVDLAMHMSHSRLRVFARKPVPVQIAWLAYPGGTGLEAMDYRITDAHLDPPGHPLTCYTERSIRLGDLWCCYDPLSQAPPAPQRDAGSICFGSINNPCKLNDPLLALWAGVMRQTKGSMLLVQSMSQIQREQIRTAMARGGIGPERVSFVGRLTRPEYLRLYDRIDIGLDPLPYNGITTTCDALWMGVPVVTLKGRTAAGRAGAGILSCVGLSEFVCESADQFVATAWRLAGDRSRLTDLRKNLRRRMESSPVMDAAGFARKMESAYRHAWIDWCARA